MAAIPKIAEEAVEKIDSKLECSICFDHFKEPKLLPCFHTFCKSPCLERLVVQDHEGKSLTCPTCRHLVPLTDSGITGLQTDFHINHLFDIRESLEKAMKQDCENCKQKSSATKYCQLCRKFMCEKCTEVHQMWGDFSDHTLLDITEVSVDATNILATVKQIPKCEKHSKVEARIYCETCSKLICNDCTIGLHRDHNYYLVDDVFLKHKEELRSSLKPVRENLDTVQRALEALDIRAMEINNQRATIETDIHREIDQLHRLLNQRRVELVASLDVHTQHKQKEVATQKDHVEMMHAKMSSCLEYAEGTLETGTEGEILSMKAPVLKRIKQITAEFDPDTIQPQTEADTKLFTDELDHVRQACREFREVACDPVSAENSYATRDGTKFAAINTQANVEVHAMTKQNKECKHSINLTAELVHTKSEDRIKCDVGQEKERHTITYKPVSRGKHSLHIRINKKHIQGSPYPIAITPSQESLHKPTRVVRGFIKPFDVTTNNRGQIIVVDGSGHCISVLTPGGNKIFSFGTQGSGEGQWKYPDGATVDQNDNIYIADNNNHCIQKFTSNGAFVAAVGSQGRNQLQFYHPIGICFNKTNQNLYVCDQFNHRIQILSTDLTFVKCFGSQGSGNGQFKYTKKAAFDDSNHLHVTDGDNHRVQVFTADGQFLRAFTNKADGQQLEYPLAIAIDSSNTVYVSEKYRLCVSVFTPQGEYITSFGTRGTEEGQFKDIQGLCVDQKDSVIVCEVHNSRLQIF